MNFDLNNSLDFQPQAECSVLNPQPSSANANWDQLKLADREKRVHKSLSSQNKIASKLGPLCPHDRRRSRCKLCGGGSICPHGRRKSDCKECNGGSICQHSRRRSICHDCGGGGICEHKRVRSLCKECGGGSVCKHQRQRSHCKECGGGSICEHRRIRSTCKECHGGSICEHNKRRSRCKECGGRSTCEHNKRKSSCKECSENSYCPHYLKKYICPKCRLFCIHQVMLAQCAVCSPKICPHQQNILICKDCNHTLCRPFQHKEICDLSQENNYQETINPIPLQSKLPIIQENEEYSLEYPNNSQYQISYNDLTYMMSLPSLFNSNDQVIGSDLRPFLLEGIRPDITCSNNSNQHLSLISSNDFNDSVPSSLSCNQYIHPNDLLANDIDMKQRSDFEYEENQNNVMCVDADDVYSSCQSLSPQHPQEDISSSNLTQQTDLALPLQCMTNPYDSSIEHPWISSLVTTPIDINSPQENFLTTTINSYHNQYQQYPNEYNLSGLILDKNDYSVNANSQSNNSLLNMENRKINYTRMAMAEFKRHRLIHLLSLYNPHIEICNNDCDDDEENIEMISVIDPL
mmetsp:Transcript_40587/g.41430  ORF Transcript_40587/g.41430 Transcript_40587/m.41430 type:complete len:576 (+) Transcript_40587:66-1793(+)